MLSMPNAPFSFAQHISNDHAAMLFVDVSKLTHIYQSYIANLNAKYPTSLALLDFISGKDYDPSLGSIELTEDYLQTTPAGNLIALAFPMIQVEGNRQQAVIDMAINLQSQLANNPNDATEAQKALSSAADTFNLFARLVQIKTTAEARFEELINNPAEPHSREEAILVLEPFFIQFSEGAAQLYKALMLQIPNTMTHFYSPASPEQLTCFDICLEAVHSLYEWVHGSSTQSNLSVNKTLDTEPLIPPQKTLAP